MGTVRAAAPAGSGHAPAASAEEVAAELAWCLSRFLDATADEPVMQRAKQALADWEATRPVDVDLTLIST